MKNNDHLNLLQYWRNTLADAARVEIPVDKVLSIRDVSVDFQAGRISQQQVAQLIERVEKQRNEKKGLTHKGEAGWEEVDEIGVLLAPFRVSPIPEFTRMTGERGIFYPFWIRAILTKVGYLRPDEDTFPYIRVKCKSGTILSSEIITNCN